MYYYMHVPATEDYGVTNWGKASDGAGRFTAGEFNNLPVEEDLSLEVDFTNENPPRDLLSDYIPVMSGKFIDALKKAGVDNLQTYPVLLRNTNAGLTWDNFFIVNVIGKIACADLEHSEGKELLGGYHFKKLVIDVEKAKGALFFRLFESHGMIIAHYDIARTMFTEQNEPKFRGVYFEPIKSLHNLLKEKSNG